MLMDPHPSQQHASLQHVVLLQQQDATKLEAKFKQKSEVVGQANRRQHILVICFTWGPQRDLKYF